MVQNDVTGVAMAAPVTDRTVTVRRRPRHALRRLAPLCWLGPSLLLIGAVIVYPAIVMVRTSLERYDFMGDYQGPAGLDNFRQLFGEPAFPHVVYNTLLWVVLVVGVTVVASLPLAQFLNKRFAGRRVVRWALIVPWAASLSMTATLWRYIYEGGYGMLNRALLDLHMIHSPVYWYTDQATELWCLIFVGIIVSVPFTTYVFLAGLQSVPADLYEAVSVDGGTGWQAYKRVTLPLLKPALLVAVVLNTIYVLNSFPIIWVITQNNTGNFADTTITFMYKTLVDKGGGHHGPGEAAALSVLNVAVLIVLVGLYVRHQGTGGPEAGTGKRRGRAWWSSVAGRAGDGAGAVAAALGVVTGPVRRAIAAALRRPSRAAERAWRPARPFTLPVIGALVVAFFLAPYAVMFLSALKSQHDLFHSPALYLPTHWEWGNFTSVWNTVPFAFLVNSLIIASASTLLVLLVSLPAAYFTARHSFPGRRAFLYLILVTQMFAPVALLVGIEKEVIGFHGMNTYWAIVLVDAGFALAFSTWIINGYLASIPVEVEEAAKVDGAGPFRALVRVVLPLARPAIVTAVIFTFIQVWNEFVVATTIFNNPMDNRETLTMGISLFVGEYTIQYNELFVASLIGIVPVVILFAAIERHLVSGLTAGSIK
jgi:multiple sugar transport system permease protein